MVRPDDFARVQIDLSKLGMKLAWKPRGDAAWISYESVIPFPKEVIANPTKSVAGKLILENLPTSSNDDDTLNNTGGSSFLSAATSDGSSTPDSVIQNPAGRLNSPLVK